MLFVTVYEGQHTSGHTLTHTHTHTHTHSQKAVTLKVTLHYKVDKPEVYFRTVPL